MPHKVTPSPRLVQLVKDPESIWFGLKPAQADRILSWMQAEGLFDPCANCGTPQAC